MKLFEDGPVDVIAEVDAYKAAMLVAAMRKAKGNKTEAARLLCLNNYQTVNNWIEKYKMTEVHWE